MIDDATEKKSRRTGTVRVLSLGYIEELLSERHRLLNAAGFEVTSVDTKSKALKMLENREFDVLVVGHGVPVNQRNEIAIRAKVWRKAGVIFLYRWNIKKAEFADAVVSVDGGSEHLADAILRIAPDQGSAESLRRKRGFSI